MRNARTVIAPAGGKYNLSFLIKKIIIHAAAPAASGTGALPCTAIRSRQTIPTAAHIVTRIMTCMLLFDAGQSGLVISVNATKSGGAKQNFMVNPDFAVMLMHKKAPIARRDALTKASFILVRDRPLKNGIGTGILFFISNFSNIFLVPTVISVSIIAEIGYIMLCDCMSTGKAIADIIGAKVVPDKNNIS